MDFPDLSVSALARDRDGTCAVVTLAGRAGIADAAWFRRLLELPEARESGRIILDLSRLSSIDWWATLILLWVGRMVSRRGGTLVLASPQPAVARLLTGADLLFSSEVSNQQAGEPRPDAVQREHGADGLRQVRRACSEP